MSLSSSCFVGLLRTPETYGNLQHYAPRDAETLTDLKTALQDYQNYIICQLMPVYLKINRHSLLVA